MTWQDESSKELSAAKAAIKLGNAGLARTCARRAAGIALLELQRASFGRTGRTDYITLLREYMNDADASEGAREAAKRLQKRLREDFTSDSKDPVQDAEVILQDVRRRLGEDQSGSSER